MYNLGNALRPSRPAPASELIDAHPEEVGPPEPPEPVGAALLDEGPLAERPLRRGDRTRAKILDAAEEVFGRLGYHSASVVEITRQAGVGLGTFYLYFPSKLEMYRTLLRSRQEDFIRAAREATSGAGDYREIIRGAFRAFFGWISERPAVMRLLREAEFVDPGLIVSLYEAPAEEYRSRLGRAMELGYISRTDPAVLAWCLMGMTEFTVLRWLVWPDAQGLDDERFEAFVEIMIRVLGVQAPEAR